MKIYPNVARNEIERKVLILAENRQSRVHIPDPYLLGWRDRCRGVMWTVTTAFIPYVGVVIDYGLVKSHPSSNRLLCPVMWLEQAGYRK
jgi:hypothetical protein